MVKFWIEKRDRGTVVCSNLKALDLGKVTVVELTKLCIAKWEFIAVAIDEDESLEGHLICGGCNTCALCQQFLVPQGCCADCPVALIAGESECFNTPFDKYRARGIEPEMVQDEIAFLYEVLEWVEDLATIKE